jgi:hypothetical protein
MIDGRISQRKLITLGADPEIFVFSGQKLIPAYEFLPPKGEDNLMYWDGFQAEWKYNHEGNHCQNNLVWYTREHLQELQARALAHNLKARLSLTNVVRIPDTTLKTAHHRHVELGCMPSYNAYEMKGEVVLDPRKLKYRFAGGHMHFGTWNVRPSYEKIVKTLDKILGVWSVGVARFLDNPIRRQYYGLAGEYRKPHYDTGYGVEYRVLSNFWLDSPGLLQLTWDIGRLCVRLAASRYSNMWATTEQEVIETINNCDFEQANKIMLRNRPMFTWMLHQVYRSREAVNKAVELSQQGLEVSDDFTKNWHFGEEWIKNAGQPWARYETSC